VLLLSQAILAAAVVLAAHPRKPERVAVAADVRTEPESQESADVSGGGP
jgi:hypothetical protein